MSKFRIVRKTSPKPTKTKKERKPKITNRQLIEEQLSMYTNMPDEICKLRGWDPEQLEAEIVRLETALGLSKSGKMRRTKGATYERKISRKFLEKWKIKLVRTPMSGGFQKAQDNDSIRGDLTCLDEDIFFRLHTECKDHKTWHPKEWYSQAESDCPPNKIPVVICHRGQKIVDGKRVETAEDFVLLKLDDFLEITDTNKVIIPAKGKKKR
ncbi:hypothetical protein D1872_81360 [compost metagenome]